MIKKKHIFSIAYRRLARLEMAAIEGDESHQVSSHQAERPTLLDLVRALPLHAVADLLSLPVCIRCTLRLFGVQGHMFSAPSFSTSLLFQVLGKLTSLNSYLVDGSSEENGDSKSAFSSCESEKELVYCSICIGILQFTFFDDKEKLIRKDCGTELAVSIAEFVKQEGHQVDNFSLEISIPLIVLENEKVVRSYVKGKYASEIWFQEKFLPEPISAKDTLKLSIANALEKLLGVKSGPGSLRIRLTYTHNRAPIKAQNSSDANQGSKRRKTGSNDILESVAGSMGINTEASPFSSSDVDKNIEIFSVESPNNELTRNVELLPKFTDACHLTYHCSRTPIYIGGRYLKYSRNVSQTRWVIDDERMGESSVEEIIGSNVLSTLHGDNYKFQAAGREDIDVRMLGSGRPFLLEIQNARHLPSEVFLKEVERKINGLKNKLVEVKNLKVLGSEGRNLIHEGESEKQKEYAALVWISRPLGDEDLQTISSFKDMEILQRTPIRVLHRRSPLEREKIIHWMKIEKITGNSQYFILHLCTQAGTYIKEFVHGDLGRCHPSVGSILRCRAEIVQLDVINVKMDCFV